MYISTFEFKKVRLLRNADLVHKTVMMMFDRNRAEENVLYMLMDSKKDAVGSAPVHMIVQSDKQPKNIPSELKLLNCRECSGVMDGVKNGDVVKLYGVFEPQRRNRKVLKNRNCMYLLKTPSERQEWMQRKFSPAGNLIAANEIVKHDVHISKKSGDTHNTSFFGYECLLQVTNAEEFKSMVQHGIGRSRAYGAGLCLVLEVKHV